MTNRRQGRRAFLGALGAGAAASLSGCLDARSAVLGGTPEPTTVRLLLDWKANGTHAGNFVAAEKGFDEEEGVSLSIESGSGGSTTAEQVGLRKYEIGLTSAASVLGARNGDVSIRSYAAAQQGPNSVVYTVAEQFGGAIEEPSDLAGKTVAAASSSSNLALLKALLDDAGVLGEVEFLSVGWGGLTSSLLSGDADAALGAFPDGIAMERDGYDASMLWLSDHVASTGRLVAANPTFAEEQGEALRGALRAIARGWAWAANDPPAAMDLMIDAEPRLEGGRELGIRKIEGTVAKLMLTDAVSEHGWGWQAGPDWESVQQTLAAAGFVSGEADAEAAWSNAYLDGDAAAVGSFAGQVSADYTDDWR
ncbi:hypothetical protein JCM30237_07010 [Halolamina litorea]|uniref:Thiamine pyrimidine synthase n=1 Tax=Halolamina litorea TaxID=1515593 RepID=A0ABD6BRB1_9EURY|nr:ABC transporter substrate-binding protein [Halolamina litorea]